MKTNDVSVIYVLDSYALIYRSYFAFISKPLVNKDGKNVSAVFGFFRTLKNLLDFFECTHFVCAFDSIGPTFRHEQYAQYKATRQKTPEDLHSQIPVIKNILNVMGIPCIEQNGFEADDLIASVAKKASENGMCCRIISGDKDLMQLVDRRTEMVKSNKTGGFEVAGSEAVFAEWGVNPEKMLDLLSLTGDASDNVPGVAGIGAKTAARLLDEWGDLENIYAHIEEVSAKMKAAGNKLKEGKESAFFSRSLIELKNNLDLPPLENFSIEVDVDVGGGKKNKLDYAAAAAALKECGVNAVAESYASSFASSSAAAAAGAPAPSALDKSQYKALVSKAELGAYIADILSMQDAVCAFDTETDSLAVFDEQTHIVGFSLCASGKNPVYVPLNFPGNLFSQNSSGITYSDAFAELHLLFDSPAVTLVMHNAKFDMEVLSMHGFDFEKTKPKIFDTMIAAWLVESDFSSFSLESLSLAKLSLNTVAFNDVVPKGGNFSDVPLQEALLYAAEDADLTLRLYDYYAPKLLEFKLEELFWNIEMPLVFILAKMEKHGIKIECGELMQYGAELEQKIALAEKSIYDEVGHTFNIASTKQLQDVLFGERNLPVGKKTKTGYSTDTTVLEELSHLDPVPRKILFYRMLSKLKSTYVDTLPQQADAHSLIHTSFLQTGTATGRLACRDPNLQNIPIRDEEGRRIRHAFSCQSGNTLISADYAQIELVVLAHLSGDANLHKAFSEGADVHCMTASLIFGKDPQDIGADERRIAKTINFGVVYGMSAFRLSNALGISRTEAAAFMKTYNETYSGVQDFFTRIIGEAEKTGYVETLFGRRRIVKNIASGNKMEKNAAERVAKNTPIQGSAADIVKKAMLNLDAALNAQSNLHAKMLLQVHDELILECPKNESQTVCALVKSVMENVVTLRVPLRVSIESGERWGDFH